MSVKVPALPRYERAVAFMKQLCTERGFRYEDLVGRDRHATIAAFRHEVAYLLKNGGFSFPEVGGLLGGRDHTTAMSSHAKHDLLVNGGVPPERAIVEPPASGVQLVARPIAAAPAQVGAKVEVA